MNNNSAAASSSSGQPNSNRPRAMASDRSPPRAPGARGSRDPAPAAAPAAAAAAPAAAPAGPRELNVVVSRFSNDLLTITITGFHAHEMDFTRLENHAHNHLLEAIDRAISNRHHVFRAKIAIEWDVVDKHGESFIWHMSLNIMNILPAAHGVSAADHAREFLDKVAAEAHNAIENAKMRETGIVFEGMRKVTISLVRGHRAYLLGPPERPRGNVGRGAGGGGLPAELRNRQCCLNIGNKDEFCFRYALTAWRRPCEDSTHAGRASQYITNAPAGRYPRDFVPEFVDCGLDFSMLTYPVKIDDLHAFEVVNDVGIYVFEWRDGMAVPVRRPVIARKPESEVCLLLYNEHWVLVKNPHALLRGPKQKNQFFCYRCQKVFWHDYARLAKHLSGVSPKSCLEISDDMKAYRLPKPEHSCLKHKNFQNVLHHPLVVYADFETFQSAVDDDDKMFSKMTGVASYGYYVDSRIPQITSGVRIVRGTAVDFLKDLLDLGKRFRDFVEKPVPLIWNEDLEDDFIASEHCYLCGRHVAELFRDHDHFTGQYRGAICRSCNRKASVPKQIIVYFHNLEAFDGHCIVRAISKLNRSTGSDDVATPPGEDSESESDSDSESESDSESDSDSDSECKDEYKNQRNSILGNTSEKYMQVVYGPLCFRDSFRFNATSLEKWIESQRGSRTTLAEAFPILRSHHPFIGVNGTTVEESLDLILRKVPMSYKSITSEDYFNLPAVLERSAYDDDLNETPCSDEAYALVHKVVRTFGLQNQGDYHDLYLYTDVLALADVMNAMRDAWHRRFGLDMAHYVTLASCSYDSMLKMTNAKIELINENNGGHEFMDKINANIRGGVCCIFQPYAKANNWTALPAKLPEGLSRYETLHDQVRNKHFLSGVNRASVDELLPEKYKHWMVENGYNPHEPTTWIMYVDANSLYPTVMSEALPVSGYNKMDLPDTVEARLELLSTLVKSYRRTSSTGYFVEVTYHVPEELHDFFDFAPIVKREVDRRELSKYQQDLYEQYGSKVKTTKLFPFLGEQRCTMHHIEHLQFLIELGVKVTDVHTLWSFRQRAWMKNYIKDLTKMRCESTDEVERQVCKIAMNSLYGKTCQDKMKQRQMKAHFDSESFANASAKAVDFTHMMYNDDDEGFFGFTIPERRKGPLMNTPRAVAFTVLELSKLHVLRAHYNFFKSKLKGKLLFTDTDSLTYLIEGDNPFVEMLDSTQVDFDLQKTFKSEEEIRRVLQSVYEKDHLEARVKRAVEELKLNKGKLGAFKLESERNCIVEFVGLAPKMYSFKVMHEDGEISTYMRGKGVPSKVLKANANHESFCEMLFQPYESRVSFRTLRSTNHEIRGMNMSKRMLTALQDKTYQVSPLESRPLGHYLNDVVDDEEDEEL